MQKLDDVQARAILTNYVRGKPLAVAERRLLVRWTLGLAAKKCPGQAVEVRVVPDGATQIKSGVTNRRGTPSAVVQMSPHIWLDLVLGKISWQEAQTDPSLLASGTGADLTDVFPIIEAKAEEADA